MEDTSFCVTAPYLRKEDAGWTACAKTVKVQNTLASFRFLLQLRG